MLAASATKAVGGSFTPMTSISGSYALNNFEEVLMSDAVAKCPLSKSLMLLSFTLCIKLVLRNK